MYQPLNPETRDCRVSGVRNSELGRIWGDQYNLIYNRTYRVSNSGHPNPETRGCRVTGIGCPELGTRSEFRTPEPRNLRLPGLGYRVSGTRNSTYRVPSSGHPIPVTRQPRVSGFGCPEFETRSEFRTPETRDPAVSGFGVRGLVHLGLGFGTENLTYIFLGLDLVVDVYMYPTCLIHWWLHQLYVLMEHI
ncbi:hypothetical protein EV424DRAFT_1350180 [Suillus variegatus]|nr:hypothetical protein EV424DRAFT_1350180 [Suillus variegatus]